MIINAPTVQSPKAYDQLNLQGAQLAARVAAAASATVRGNVRTALQDVAYLYKIHASETAAGLLDANLTFGFEVGDVRRYGADPTGAADSTTAFQRAVSAATAAGGLNLVTIPGGTYNLSATLQWGFSYLHVRATGKVVLNWPAASATDLIQIDGGAAGGGIYGVRVEGWIRAVGNALTLNAWFVRACHHSFLQLRAGDSLVGIRVSWCVCTVFDSPTCSSNEGPFAAQVPAIGLALNIRGAGETTSYCTVVSPVMEGITSGNGVGIDIDGGLGIQILGGTSESNKNGMVHEIVSRNTIVRGMDFESNTVHDLVLSGGTLAQFYDCSFGSIATSSPNIDMQVAVAGVAFYGGYIRWINLQADHCAFYGCTVAQGGGIGIQNNTHLYKAYGVIVVDGSGNFVSDQPDQVGEAGTFTPTIAGATTPGTQAYSSQTGYYQRVGRVVHFVLRFVLTANGGGAAGTARISGLPIASRNQTNCFHCFTVNEYTGVTLGAAGRTLYARMAVGGTTLDLLESDTGSVDNFIAITAVGATAAVVISGSYLTD